MSSFQERLPCELTDLEVARKADELSREVKQHAKLEADKRDATAVFSKAIKDSDQKIVELAEMVRDRKEYRQVECVEKRNFVGNVIDVIRKDTGGLVRSRAMKADERQGEIFDVTGVRAGYTKDPDERETPDDDEEPAGPH